MIDKNNDGVSGFFLILNVIMSPRVSYPLKKSPDNLLESLLFIFTRFCVKFVDT